MGELELGAAALNVGVTGAIAGATIPSGASAGTQAFFEFAMRPLNTSSQSFTIENFINSAPIKAASTTSIDFTTSDRAMNIYATLGNAADTARIDEVEVHIEGA